jgi:integrase
LGVSSFYFLQTIYTFFEQTECSLANLDQFTRPRNGKETRPPDLGSRVKGVKKLGARPRQLAHARAVPATVAYARQRTTEGETRSRLLAILLACGVRRHEAVDLQFGHIQQSEEPWAIIDLKGKAGHIRASPIPGWVKFLLDDRLQAANLTAGGLFRRANKNGKAWGESYEMGSTFRTSTRMPFADATTSCAAVGGVPDSEFVRVLFPP